FTASCGPRFVILFVRLRVSSGCGVKGARTRMQSSGLCPYRAIQSSIMGHSHGYVLTDTECGKECSQLTLKWSVILSWVGVTDYSGEKHMGCPGDIIIRLIGMGH
ncbi:hypothetical protein NPIL_407241, partial [Nephila pilipes]